MLSRDWPLRRQASRREHSPLEEHADFLLALIELEPDLTLDEVVGAMREHKFLAAGRRSGGSFSVTRLRLKKGLRAAEQERADVARARRRWRREQGLFDPARLVFIDETSANTKMARLYGRCARGKRLVDLVPHGHWKTITFVAALRQHGMRRHQHRRRNERKAFLTYVERCLAPTLQRKISSPSTIFRRTRLPAFERPSKRAARRFDLSPNTRRT